MGIDIDNVKYNKLKQFLKSCDNSVLEMPIYGEQARYKETATFEPKETFVSLMNRKGHIRKDNLTFIMRSNSSGVMMRYDVIGADHNGTPTPHLHVFDGEHDNGTQVISGKELGELGIDTSSPDILVETLEKFLTYNNIDLNGIYINNTAI